MPLLLSRADVADVDDGVGSKGTTFEKRIAQATRKQCGVCG